MENGISAYFVPYFGAFSWLYLTRYAMLLQHLSLEINATQQHQRFTL